MSHTSTSLMILLSLAIEMNRNYNIWERYSFLIRCGIKTEDPFKYMNLSQWERWTIETCIQLQYQVTTYIISKYASRSLHNDYLVGNL